LANLIFDKAVSVLRSGGARTMGHLFAPTPSHRMPAMRCTRGLFGAPVSRRDAVNGLALST
jgi:hypothetical protein